MICVLLVIGFAARVLVRICLAVEYQRRSPLSVVLAYEHNCELCATISLWPTSRVNYVETPTNVQRGFDKCTFISR